VRLIKSGINHIIYKATLRLVILIKQYNSLKVVTIRYHCFFCKGYQLESKRSAYSASITFTSIIYLWTFYCN